MIPVTFITLLIIGVGSYWLLLNICSILLRLELDPAVFWITASIGSVVTIVVYRLRGFLSTIISKALHRQRHDYRCRLSEFASKIHNVFSFREQEEQLLSLVTNAFDCQQACLLFFEVNSGDFTAQACEPRSDENLLSRLKLHRQNPIVEYLEREPKPLTRQSLDELPALREWEGSDWIDNIELIVPLMSRSRLVGILLLGPKQSGTYSREDTTLLQEVTGQVGISMEKEYLREQLSERERELSVINRASAIITSSFDIQQTFDSFVGELRNVIDVHWASIALVEDGGAYSLALSSELSSTAKAGAHWSIKGTAIEQVFIHKKAIVRPDILHESKFTIDGSYLEQGVRSIVYLPLLVNGGSAIGSLIVASRQPNAYDKNDVILLEHLASQIAMPIENSRVFARVEERTRVDELTGLLNRRSLHEVIISEINRHSRYGGVFSLVILDLDSFKAFNDHHGHMAGDKLLRKVGTTVKSSIRSCDQAFRLGGDEFAILLPNTAIEAANQVAERVRKRIASSTIDGCTPVTTSLGLANWPGDGRGVNEVVAAADAALYFAKRSGGNRSQYASSERP
jgi:diguanylate cyclase (GGDEF)-like protein